MTTARRESWPAFLTKWRGEVHASHGIRITAFMFFTKHETRDTNHGFSRITACTAFGTEALQSCFSRPGLPSMMTGRRESRPAFLTKWRGEVLVGHESRITSHESRTLWPWVRKGRTTKNRRPDCRSRSPVNASLLTSARNCPAPFFLACLLTIAHGIARHCSAFLQPGQCFPAHYYPLLPGFARLCSALLGFARLKILPLSQCPRTVNRSRRASRRAPFAAAPVALRASTAAAKAK